VVEKVYVRNGRYISVADTFQLSSLHLSILQIRAIYC